MRRQSAHVDAEVLAELSAGLIDGKRATRIHAHLAGCQRCAQHSASLTEISTLLASVPSPRMPDDGVTRLNRRWPRKRRTDPPLRQLRPSPATRTRRIRWSGSPAPPRAGDGA